MRAYESSTGIGRYGIIDLLADRINDLRYRICGDPEVPTLIHVTHAKAGSTWIAHLLARLFRTRCAPRGSNAARGARMSDFVFQRGRIYSAMFLKRQEVDAHPELAGVPRVVVIRDLRDTLISLYFSLKFSHPRENRVVDETRDLLQSLDEEEGLLYLIENRLRRIADLQCSWIGHDLLLRYEELIERPFTALESALIGRLKLPISKAELSRAIRRTHFQKVFRRKLGEEDVKSHGRSGLPGDWRRYFTPEVRRHFADRFGDVLISTGYEKDLRWVDEPKRLI